MPTKGELPSSTVRDRRAMLLLLLLGPTANDDNHQVTPTRARSVPTSSGCSGSLQSARPRSGALRGAYRFPIVAAQLSSRRFRPRPHPAVLFEIAIARAIDGLLLILEVIKTTRSSVPQVAGAPTLSQSSPASSFPLRSHSLLRSIHRVPLLRDLSFPRSPPGSRRARTATVAEARGIYRAQANPAKRWIRTGRTKARSSAPRS